MLIKERVVMMIKEYDKIRLKTGELARIVEVLDTDVFLAEVATKTGDINTTEIYKKDISAKIVEVEQPLTA
jgi:hypothetical protein